MTCFLAFMTYSNKDKQKGSGVWRLDKESFRDKVRNMPEKASHLDAHSYSKVFVLLLAAIVNCFHAATKSLD